MASPNKFPVLFWVLVTTDIIGIVTNTSLLHFISKPLLMPMLMLWLFRATISSNGKKLILAGLLCSWAGDILLLFEKNGAVFFIAGLICFLLTHIFYIIYFLKIRSAEASLLRQQPWWILIVVAYGVILVWVLFPHLKEMKLPVIVYAVVICSLLLCSLHAFKKILQPSRWHFVLGALLFVISDSLLAVNKFYQPFAFAGALIMLTYCAAQYLVSLGYLKTQY